MNAIEEIKLHSIATSLQCLTYGLEEINNLHLLNSMSIILSELANLTSDKTDRKKLLDLSDRIYKSLDKQGLYDKYKNKK